MEFTTILNKPVLLENKDIRKEWKKILNNPVKRYNLEKEYTAKKVDQIDKLIKSLERKSLLMFYPVTNIYDILEEPDDKDYWLLENFIPSTGLTLLSGPPKCGKSTLARHIAWCVANDEDFLDFKNHNPGSVLWITSDENKADIKQGFSKVFSGRPKHPINLARGWFDDFEDTLDDILSEADELPSLVILDTLASGLKSEDFNSYSEMMARLTMVNATLESWRIPLIAISHNRKGYTNYSTKKASFDDILGSAAIRGSMSALIMLYRPSEKNPEFLHLSLEGRNVANLCDKLMVMDFSHGRIDYADTTKSKAFKENMKSKTKEELADILYKRAVAEGYAPTKEKAREWLGVGKASSDEAYDLLLEKHLFYGTSRNRKLLMPEPDSDSDSI